MSRLSRPDYHLYNQQAHPRWSPSPPPNRTSGNIDPRIASRPPPQEMQPQPPQMSQIAVSSSASNAELVQAVNAMSAQVTSQLSMVGTQLNNLVSLTSRLIEMTQHSLAAADSSNRAKAPVNATIAADFDPVSRADAMQGTRSNGVVDSGTLASANPTRADTRTSIYHVPSNSYRNVMDASSSNLGAMRAASPPSPQSFSNMSAAMNGRNMMQQQSYDPEDIHKSRLPSPVFPDDPMDMSADMSTSSQSTSAAKQRRHRGTQKPKPPPDPPLGDWKGWLNRNWQRAPGHNPHGTQFPTMQDARRAHRETTSRSMSTLGRLPLKEYLEIRPDQYLSIRKLGRKIYQDWLLQEVRLAKQPEDRVKAAVNKLETESYELGECEDHWKARQLLQQIIDNAIDEANLHRKREARATNAHQGSADTPSRSGDQSRVSVVPPSASEPRPQKAPDSSVLHKRGDSLVGPSATASLGRDPKAAVRRKADQADLDTPTRFRQAPSHRSSLMASSDDPASTSMQAQHSLSSTGMDARSLTDYSNYNDPGTLGSTGGGDVSRQHSQHSQHQQHQQHQQDHSQNAWANQNANPATLFGPPNYVTSAQTMPQSQHQQQYQSHSQHSAHHPNSQYMSSAPQGNVPGQGMSASNSGLLDDQRHHSQLVNSGSVRMQPPGAAGQQQNAFFDYRHHQS